MCGRYLGSTGHPESAIAESKTPDRTGVYGDITKNEYTFRYRILSDSFDKGTNQDVSDLYLLFLMSLRLPESLSWCGSFRVFSGVF